ncbi:MAG: DUF1593 domain-containing protein [Chitinophagaceae bacterium]
MKNKTIFFLLFAVVVFSCNDTTAQSGNEKPRTIVTTDGEVDDQDSFIRLLLYSNDLNIAGLIYSSSQWHYKGDGKGTLFTSEMKYTAERYGKRSELRWPGTDWMQGFIDKYAMVYDHLVLHDKNYPTPKYLKSIIKTGNIDFEGEMDKNTEGSDFIKAILLDDKPGPVYLQIWGGTNTIARALKSIEDDFKNTAQWKTIYKKISDKAILYTVLDQDATYQKYVSPNWPDIKVMYNSNQFWCLAYPWPKFVPEELQETLKGKWFAEHIKFNHGLLLSSYYLWGDGQKIVGDPEHTHGDTAEVRKYGLTQYDFISEGDSPSYLFLLNVGLRNKEDASYGGWGGRMIQSQKNRYRWEDGKDVTDYNPFTKKEDAAYPQTRWIPAIQNDFAARADWCVKDFKNANHPPVVKLNHAADINAKPGTTIQLSGSGKDPDNNELTYKWWQYKEVGSFNGTIDIRNADKAKASFIIPSHAKKDDTIHIILEVTDNGVPSLTRYQHVIVTVR